MNTKFQIQIQCNNYNCASGRITKEVTLHDIEKFTPLVKLINKNIGGNIWNWFGDGLPDKWDGKRFVLDFWKLCKHFDENFNYKVEDVNLVKEFYLRFTPEGADGISDIKFFKVEEIELK